MLVVDGINEQELVDIEMKKWDNISIEEHIRMYMRQGIDKKEAIKKVAEDRKQPKKEIYKVGCEIE